MRPAPPLVDSPTSSTSPPTLPGFNPSIFYGVFVPAWAMGFVCFTGAAQSINPRRNWLKVIRINTSFIAAEMIDLKSRTNLTPE
jgi:hypothetical protein